jgi:hypothetical protein
MPVKRANTRSCVYQAPKAGLILAERAGFGVPLFDIKKPPQRPRGLTVCAGCRPYFSFFHKTRF